MLNKSNFLKNYWQKRPLVIRQFIHNFQDPIDEHDLAGLAQEDEIDARIVRKINENWECYNGPFDSYEELCLGAWSLLVQGVDRYIPVVDSLFEHVDFLPSWRKDDVMISFSVEGAGVGAHIDQYDVFIIQGKGKRRWQVGEKGNYQSYTPTPSLKLIEGFDAIIDEVLEPGDAIYIPPHFPHSGTTLEDSLNYSLGFRAPDVKDLFDELSELLSLPEYNFARYSDEGTLDNRNLASPIVANAELENVKQYLIRAIKDNQFDEILMRALSKQYLLEEASIYGSKETFLNDLHQAEKLSLRAGVKPIISQSSLTEPFIFYIDGERFQISEEAIPFFEQLIYKREITLTTESLDTIVNSGESLYTLLDLINHAYIELD